MEEFGSIPMTGG